MTKVQAISRRLAYGLLLSGGLLAASPVLVSQPAMAQRPAAAAPDPQLFALENRRLTAIAAQDAAAFRAVLTDDYVHVHSTGKVDNREAFIQGIQQAAKRVTGRGPLTVRSYGNIAVITGQQTNQNAVAPGAAPAAAQTLYVTQVARRDGAGWRYVSMHATPMGPAPPNNAGAFTGYPAEPVRALTADQRAVIALEGRRAAAIAGKDFTALGNVLADDYLHVYGGGRTGGRADYLKEVTAAPRVPTRGPLNVRVYGDVAVLTGDLLNRIEYPDRPGTVLDTYVTQVARKVNGQWRFVSFQITPKTYAR